MAFGDGADDAALDGAWSEFCERLKAAGRQAFKDFNATSGLQRADAFRFLTQNLGQAFDLALETRDTRYPVIHAFCNPTRKLGGDCADFTYQQVWIDGESTYRITGTRGTARFFNITVQGARPDGQHVLHEPFGDVPEVNLFGHQLRVEPDGSFELYHRWPRARAELATDHRGVAKAVHPPGLRPLGRASGTDANRARRHDLAEAAADSRLDGRGDALGG